jgi:hypothetical protein
MDPAGYSELLPWIHLDEFTIVEAAFLILDRPPTARSYINEIVPPDVRAWADMIGNRFHALDPNEFDTQYIGGSGRAAERWRPHPWRDKKKVTRAELLIFAAEKNMRPFFLFRNEDSKQEIIEGFEQLPQAVPVATDAPQSGTESVARVRPLRPDQQDRLDFQRLCKAQWEREPTTRITGSHGIAAVVGAAHPAYPRDYEKSTLEGWAREVAPESVKGRRGRSKKI